MPLILICEYNNNQLVEDDRFIANPQNVYTIYNSDNVQHNVCLIMYLLKE
jgi:hypothetical protein